VVMKRKVDKEIPRPPSIKLRDYFGALAIQAIISRGDLDMDMNVMPYCLDAYTIADAMIETREAIRKKPDYVLRRVLPPNEFHLILALREIEARPADGKCDEMEAVNAAIESYIEESCARKMAMRHN
jgi:hypothetical protein